MSEKVPDTIGVYRITHIDNLQTILQKGIFAANFAPGEAWYGMPAKANIKVALDLFALVLRSGRNGRSMCWCTGITYAEVLVVDGEFGMSEKEYKAITHE